MTELKPCPFCGNPMLTIYVDVISGKSKITCGMNSCGGMYALSNHDATTGQLLDDLIEGWNKRERE